LKGFAKALFSFIYKCKPGVVIYTAMQPFTQIILSKVFLGFTEEINKNTKENTPLMETRLIYYGVKTSRF
jgi:hypothetical protein